MRHSWSRLVICATIQQLHQNKVPLNSYYIQRNETALYGAVLKYYGSWGQAVRAAGFSYDDLRKRKKFRNWSKAEITCSIKRRVRSSLSVNGSAVCKEDYALYCAARRYYHGDSWEKALYAAGINPKSLVDPRRVWTKERVVREIQELHAKGSPLYGKYLVGSGNEKLVAGGKKVFGSWRNAVKATHFDYEEVRAMKKDWWTKKRVIAGIRKLERQHIRLSSKAMHHSRGDLFAAAVKFFGSWSEAVTAAGIDYQRHAKTWSSKAWLRSLNREVTTNIGHRLDNLTLRRRGGSHASVSN